MHQTTGSKVAQQLQRGDIVPGGVVEHAEVCSSISKVAVWLSGGRIVVYSVDELVASVYWWVGTSIEAVHKATAGPFTTQSDAVAHAVKVGQDQEVFALPRSQKS